MISEVFIVSRNGIPLASWSAKKSGHKVDPGLVGGFLSAVSMFAGGATGEEVKVIGLDPSLLLFEEKQDFFSVVMVNDPKAKDLGEYILKAVTEQFISDFRKNLKDFSGSVEIFTAFNAKIGQIITECGADAIVSWQKQHKKGLSNLGGLLLLERDTNRLLYREGIAVQNLDPVLYFVPALVEVSSSLIDRLDGGKMVRFTANPMEPEQLVIETRGLANVVTLSETGRDWTQWIKHNSTLSEVQNLKPSVLGQITPLSDLIKTLNHREHAAPLLIAMDRSGDSWVFTYGKAQENVVNFGLVEIRRWWSLEREIAKWIFNNELWISYIEGEAISAVLFSLGNTAILQIGPTKLIRQIASPGEIEDFIRHFYSPTQKLLTNETSR